MNDWQKMDYHASSGEWDQALALASKLKHQGALAVLANNFQIPPSHINSFLERMPRNDIPGTIYELSENLHPDLSSDDLHKIWKHVSGDYLTTKNIIEHPNFKGADAGQKAAGEFWNSYEIKVNPSHFAAIKSALTGEPESLETHRGIGHSSAHELQIPHLIKHMESSQQAILKDPTIPKQYVNGEPHIVVYRGVGGSYAKAIKNGFGIKNELNEGGPKSTIERHKTVNVPSTHMASWSIDKKMAVRFAGARGDHDSVGNPHHVIIKKLVPVRAVLHSGMHSLYPGHQPAHIRENEVVLMHPSASYKVSSKDVEVGHPEKTGLVLPESFKPLEKKTAIKKSSDSLAPLIQQAKANLAAVSKVASQEPRSMLFGNRAGTSHGFVSLDPSKPNQWRVTHFVKGQPSGHTEAASFSDAIKKAHSYGYNVSKELSEEDMSKGQFLEKTNASKSQNMLTFYHGSDTLPIGKKPTKGRFLALDKEFAQNFGNTVHEFVFPSEKILDLRNKNHLEILKTKYPQSDIDFVRGNSQDLPNAFTHEQNATERLEKLKNMAISLGFHGAYQKESDWPNQPVSVEIYNPKHLIPKQNISKSEDLEKVIKKPANKIAGGTYESVLHEGDGFKVVSNYRHDSLYHGSPAPIDKFSVSKGSGQFGNGLYLAHDENTGRFHAQGQRQGASGQRPKGEGHLYKGTLHAPIALIVTDDDEFGKTALDHEDAEEAHSAIGDHLHPLVTKHWGNYAKDYHGANALVFSPSERSVSTPFTQTLALDGSKVKMNLINKPEPIKKSEDFSRVSSVVVATDDRMLMLQRRDNGKWTFPGGHLNETESHLEGAVRELWEEAGIRANPDEMILLGNKKTFQNKDIYVYLYVVSSEVATTASNDPDKEAQKFEWIPHIIPKEIVDNLYIPVGDNSSLSMFSKWLLRKKVDNLKRKLKKD